MTIKYLTGNYPGGYTLGSQYRSLVIEPSATVGGNGIVANFKATITNLGTIQATTSGGVYLPAGGIVINGSSTDTSAIIESASFTDSVTARYGSAKVTNYGTMGSVYLKEGGTVANGSTSDTTAQMSGVTALFARVIVTNSGTINGRVFAEAGGTVTNGSSADHNAFIESIGSSNGTASIYDAAISVTNFGTVKNTNDRAGVFMGAGGTVTNGSNADTSALISSLNGVYAVQKSVAVTNFGTIQASKFAGIFLSHGGSVTNGSAADTSASIQGDYGVYANQTSTAVVTNFGTINGSGGVAVYLANATDRLVVEPKSAFIGAVEAGGGTLELASGTGTINGLGSAFSGFGSYVVDSGGAWTLSGTNVIAGGATLTNNGSVNQIGTITIGDTTTNAASLSISQGATWTMSGAARIGRGTSATSSLTNAGNLIRSGSTGVSVVGLLTVNTGLIEAAAGTLDFTQKLAGTGTLRIDAGATLELDSSAAKTLSVAFNGSSAMLALRFPKLIAAKISGYAPADTIDLLKTAATGASINASDQLVIVNGATTVATLQLTGSYTGATFSVGSDGKGGTDIVMLTAASVTPSMASTSSNAPHAFIAAMAQMGTESATALAGSHSYSSQSFLAAPKMQTG